MAARTVAGFVGAVALMLSVAGPSAAAWGTPGSGSGGGRAATLTPPAAVSASCSVVPTNGIDVSWSAVTPARPGTQYQVERSSNGGTTWTTITTTTGTTVRDTPTAQATYRYRVLSRLGQWASPAGPLTAPRTISLGLICG